MAVKRPCFFDRAESGTHTNIYLCDCIGMLHSSESGRNDLLNSHGLLSVARDDQPCRPSEASRLELLDALAKHHAR
jgi:hypothetical protein